MGELDVKLLPSAGYLHECFVYEPETGELCWRVRPREHFATGWMCASWNARFAGTGAGCVDSKGHWKVHVNYGRYQLHRIIWKWMTGEEPPISIDHIDADRANNRWDNLRPASRASQKWNSRLRGANTSGYSGVRIRREGKCEARIQVNGVSRCIGSFSTPEEASAAYEAAAREAHGEFYRSLSGRT